MPAAYVPAHGDAAPLAVRCRKPQGRSSRPQRWKDAMAELEGTEPPRGLGRD